LRVISKTASDARDVPEVASDTEIDDNDLNGVTESYEEEKDYVDAESCEPFVPKLPHEFVVAEFIERRDPDLVAKNIPVKGNERKALMDAIYDKLDAKSKVKYQAKKSVVVTVEEASKVAPKKNRTLDQYGYCYLLNVRLTTSPSSNQVESMWDRTTHKRRLSWPFIPIEMPLYRTSKCYTWNGRNLLMRYTRH